MYGTEDTSSRFEHNQNYINKLTAIIIIIIILTTIIMYPKTVLFGEWKDRGGEGVVRIGWPSYSWLAEWLRDCYHLVQIS